MIISHKHKFIFLKTRRTGSTSLELFIFPYCGAADVVTKLSTSSITRSTGHRAQNQIRSAFRLDPRPAINRFWPLKGSKAIDFHDHIAAADVRAYVGEKVWHSYFKFSFDRNIYDRQVSWFHHKTRTPSLARRWPDFDSFLKGSPDAVMDNYQIYTIGGELAVDYIGRYETLPDDLTCIMRTLGLSMSSMPLARKSPGRTAGTSYREFYTPETRALVEQWYPGERRLFGHEF
jgi:hypothetical protein